MKINPGGHVKKKCCFPVLFSLSYNQRLQFMGKNVDGHFLCGHATSMYSNGNIRVFELDAHVFKWPMFKASKVEGDLWVWGHLGLWWEPVLKTTMTSKFHSNTIREASSCSRRNKSRDPPADITTQRAWSTQPYIRCLHPFLPIKAQRTPQKSVRARLDGGHQESKAFYINWAQVIWTHRVWSSKHRAYMGLDQILYIYTTAFSLVFLWNSWVCEQPGLWLLCFLLGSSPSVGLLVQLWCDGSWFTLVYFIRLHSIVITEKPVLF